MTDFDLPTLMRESMLVVLKLGGPMLAVGLAVGLLVSILQAITQVHEATLAFIPKVAALAITLMLLAPFMLATLTGYAHLLFNRIIAIGAS
jgi:flagellar biosynthetic protein FliQ